MKGKAKPIDEDRICDSCGEEMIEIPGAEKKMKPTLGFKVVAVVECKKCSVARAVFEEADRNG